MRENTRASKEESWRERVRVHVRSRECLVQKCRRDIFFRKTEEDTEGGKDRARLGCGAREREFDICDIQRDYRV